MQVYHTFFREFKGLDEKAVIQDVYEYSRKGTGLSYDDWWAWQQKLWQERYGLTIPEATHPDAARQLLQTLVKIGALVEGPKPARTPSQMSPRAHG